MVRSLPGTQLRTFPWGLGSTTGVQHVQLPTRAAITQNMLMRLL